MTIKPSMIIHVSYATFYTFEGWTFEYSRTKPFGPWPCNNDMEPKKRAGKKFYDMFERFIKMSEEEQEGYRV